MSAVVIRQRNLGEADRILTLFTREKGKLSAVARGVKRGHSKLAASLQLFARGRMQLAAGRSLDVITSVTDGDLSLGLREDVQRYAHASYAAELLDVLVEEGAPDEVLYALLVDTLGALDKAGDPATVTLGFEVKLLTRLGYGPEMAACISCGGQVEGERAGFSAAEGGVMCPRCRRAAGAGGLSRAALQGLRDLQAIPQPELGRRKLTARVKQELQGIMRGFVDYRVERPLRSAGFLTLEGPGRQRPAGAEEAADRPA